MDLHSAITTAARFCWKGKQASPMKSIRFIPKATADSRAALFANNGPEGVHIQVDGDLPNAMFDGETIANAVKGSKGEVPIERVNDKAWCINGVHMHTGNVAQYPSVPVIPAEFHSCPDWWAVEQVIHAVSTDKNREDLMCVNFTDKVVEATDRHRVARVFIEGKWSGLVPAVIFKRMPKGDVEYSFAEKMAAFRVGDETRLIMLKTGRFEACGDVLPAHYDGPAYAVRKDELEGAVKRVKGLKADRLALRFTKTEDRAALHLHGGGYVHTFATQEMAPHPTLPVEIGASTVQLHEALKAMYAPMVRLGFTSPNEPLRLDAGPLAMGFWAFTE